jgi:hypothetical protein
MRSLVAAARTMIDRTVERFGLKPERLATDSAYGWPRAMPNASRQRSYAAPGSAGGAVSSRLPSFSTISALSDQSRRCNILVDIGVRANIVHEGGQAIVGNVGCAERSPS